VRVCKGERILKIGLNNNTNQEKKGSKDIRIIKVEKKEEEYHISSEGV